MRSQLRPQRQGCLSPAPPQAALAPRTWDTASSLARHASRTRPTIISHPPLLSVVEDALGRLSLLLSPSHQHWDLLHSTRATRPFCFRLHPLNHYRLCPDLSLFRPSTLSLLRPSASSVRSSLSRRPVSSAQRFRDSRPGSSPSSALPLLPSKLLASSASSRCALGRATHAPLLPARSAADARSIILDLQEKKRVFKTYMFLNLVGVLFAFVVAAVLILVSGSVPSIVRLGPVLRLTMSLSSRPV